MHRLLLVFGVMILTSCTHKEKSKLTAQSIIDSSITASGGDLYAKTTRSFTFRGRHYISENGKGGQVLKRILKNDTAHILDVRTHQKFERYIYDSLVRLHDTTANKYANSVNSVHYFADLPYGLNDPAVNKEYLGEASIKGKTYYKVKVTFEQEGGGDDFDDTYVYWFNKQTFKPDYLAYEFHVDGGGMRFREAFNERYVNGIRYVDYNNYKANNLDIPIFQIDSLFEAGNLELLSKIELEHVQVNQGNYN